MLFAQCATPGCRTPRRGHSEYCFVCIKLRRRAYQRARRGAANPAGPLPAEDVRRIAYDFRQIREVLDYSEELRLKIENEGKNPKDLFAVYDGLNMEVRAALTRSRRILDAWSDRNNINGGDKPD